MLRNYVPARAPLSRLLTAPYEALRPVHRVRLGLADGRLGAWENHPPPPEPLYRDQLYWAAYRCQRRLSS